MDLTAPSNRLLIRTTDGKANYLGNAFNNDGGPVSFSRASLGTVVDADGKVKWAPHNLLLASEQFDAASWTKTTTTVAANSVAAPNSTTTAETLTAGGANSTTLQSYSASAVAYTFGVWLKRKTGTGTIQIAADSGTWNTVTITADWALYTIAQTPAAGTISAGIRIVTSGDEVYAWGAHLYRSDLGGMQANASAYPMYNPTTPKNLLGFTESFDNAAWQRTRTTVSANGIVAPNGLMTADALIEDTSGSTHAVYQYYTMTVGAAYTVSFYAKANTRSFIRILLGDSNGGNAVYLDVNLTTGAKATATNGSGWTVQSSSVTDVGNGWYRCSITGANNSATTGVVILYLASALSTISYTGNGTSGVYICGAQLSDSASLDTYTRNNFAAPSAAAYYGPRLDYDPSTLAAKGLLVEEQRTNLLLRSAEFDNASWSKTATGTGSAPVVTANAATAPDGTLTADQVDLNAGAGTTSSDLSILGQAITVATTTSYNGSIYVKAATSGDVGKTIGFRHVAAGSFTVVTLTAVWTRVSISETSISTSANFVVACRGGLTSASASVLVWGAQLEAGSFATSYIPTTTASVTRSADVAQIGTAAFPYSATEGSLIVSAQLGNASGTAYFAALSAGASTNDSLLMYAIPSFSRFETAFRTAGTLQVSLNNSNAGAPNAGTVYKNATAFKVNDFASVINGTTAVTSSSGSVPSAADTLAIGVSATGTLRLNGHIRQITYIPRRATNAELQQRTS